MGNLQTNKLWLRYVDDTFTAVHKNEIDAFHDHQNADIRFTKEIEENGKLPFLDCLVSRDNNELRTTENRRIRRLQMTSSPPCWMTINKRILINSIVPAIQHGGQGLCHLNLTGMVANHLYGQIIWRIILQPDFTQSHDDKDFNETSATSLWYTGQLTWRKQIPWTCFYQKQLQRWLK